MIVVILCAGYGTRLYPYTLDMPKALLDINGKPLLSFTIENVLRIRNIKKIYVVSNDCFFSKFDEWKCISPRIEIINDFTKTNEARIGGVMDFALALKKIGNEDILVLLGDNYFSFPLKDFASFFKSHRRTSIALYDIKDKEQAKRFGVLEINDSKIISLEEKPENPKSTFVSTGCYIFSKEKIKDLYAYINSDKKKEGMAYIIKDFLEKEEDVRGFVFEERWYDIGTIEDYERIKREIKDMKEKLSKK